LVRANIIIRSFLGVWLVLAGLASALFAEEAYFEVNASSQRFVIRLTDPRLIQEARNIVHGRQNDRVSVTGWIVKAPAPYNPGWSFHVDPNSISFFSLATEVCDAAVPYVEEHLAEVGGAFLPGNRWCPWSSKVAREIPEPAGAQRMLLIASGASFSEVAISPGSLASGFARAMTDRTEAASTLELPQTLAGLTVDVFQRGEAQGQRARLLFASPNQANFLVPDSIRPGPVSVVITHASGARFDASSRAEIVAPSLFFSVHDQQRYAAALLVRVRPDGAQSTESLFTTNPSGAVIPRAAEMTSPNEKLYLSLFGTGIRNASSDMIRVWIGAETVPVLFSGPQGATPGLDQINVALPPSLWNSPEASIRLSAPADLGMVDAVEVKILLKRSTP
jgi:uncharacterized protein (TIGR03437 family)